VFIVVTPRKSKPRRYTSHSWYLLIYSFSAVNKYDYFCVTICQQYFVVDVIGDGTSFYYRSASGTITSPNYPAFYPKNKKNYYYIDSPVVTRITLYVQFFDLEYDPSCSSDWLQVLTVSLLFINRSSTLFQAAMPELLLLT
jgi:CUB domain